MKQSLVLVVLAFQLVSCSSPRKASGGLGEPFLGGQYVFFGYQVIASKGTKAPTNCVLQLESLAKPHRTYEYVLDPTATYLLAAVEPRDYKVSRIQCGYSLYRVSNVFGLKDATFTVHAGRLNFVGATRLVFSHEGDLNFEWGQKASIEFLKSVSSQMSRSMLARLTNAYTGKVISKEFIDNTQALQRFNVRYKSGETTDIAGIQKTTENLKAEVQRCFRQEEEINPMRFGRLDFEVAYEGRKHLQTQLKGDSAYSDRLTQCLGRAFQVTKVSTAARLEYSLEL